MLIMRARSSSPTAARAAETVLSEEPSSINKSSMRVWVCFSMLSTARAIYSSALYAGIITETKGLYIYCSFPLLAMTVR